MSDGCPNGYVSLGTTTIDGKTCHVMGFGHACGGRLEYVIARQEGDNVSWDVMCANIHQSFSDFNATIAKVCKTIRK